MEASKGIIVLIGSSIYSNFVKKHFSGNEFIFLNGTCDKIYEKIDTFIKNKDKIHSYLVIDGTHLSIKKREPILALAKTNDISVKCFWMKPDSNVFSFPIPKIFHNMFSDPSVDEGFSEIRVIDVV